MFGLKCCLTPGCHVRISKNCSDLIASHSIWIGIQIQVIQKGSGSVDMLLRIHGGVWVCEQCPPVGGYDQLRGRWPNANCFFGWYLLRIFIWNVPRIFWVWWNFVEFSPTKMNLNQTFNHENSHYTLVICNYTYIEYGYEYSYVHCTYMLYL